MHGGGGGLTRELGGYYDCIGLYHDFCEVLSQVHWGNILRALDEHHDLCGVLDR